jgi:hypothetical protein
MGQTLGIIDLVWQGAKIPLDAKSGTITLGGLKNTGLVAGRQVHRSQEYEMSMVEATTPLFAGQTLSNLFTNTEGELQVVCDTGQSFIIPDAFLTTTGNATAGDGGKVKLQWNGSQALEIS